MAVDLNIFEYVEEYGGEINRILAQNIYGFREVYEERKFGQIKDKV